MDDLICWLRLMAVPGLDANALLQISSACSVTELCQASTTQLQQLGFSAVHALHLTQSHRKAEQALQWLQMDANRWFIPFNDSRYPPLLREIKHPPVGLFGCGDPAVLQKPQIAIVGSRRPTPTGRQIALEFAAELATLGFVITSGMATGIDGAAHQGALKAKGETIAVMGHGLCHLYPPQHQALQQQIIAQGAVVSEFLPQQHPKAEFFPIRNRIVVGLSLGTLVVEAAEKSGSLISAHYAAEYSRDVFAIPGSIRNPQAAGCHQLILQGAKLTRSVADILEELAPLLAADLFSHPVEKNSCLPLLSEEGLLANVGDEATAIDLIADRAAMPVADVTIALQQLELTGAVAAVPGGYIRVRRA